MPLGRLPDTRQPGLVMLSKGNGLALGPKAGDILVSNMTARGGPDASRPSARSKVKSSGRGRAATGGGVAQRDRIRSILEALPDAAIALDADLRVLAANARARSYAPRLAQGELLAHGLRAPDLLDAVSAVAAGGKAQQAEWLEIVPVERAFEAHAAMVDGEGGEGAAFMLLVLKDVSESRRTERMRVDFIANASHELRTPLASILGFVETLQGPARNDEKAREKFLAIMNDQARRMARLVDDLLSLSRIEQKLHLQPRDRVDMVEVVRHVADTLAPLARELKVAVRLHTPAPAIVAGDRDELLRVAENLIENAIKYGCEGAGELPCVDVTVLVEPGGKSGTATGKVAGDVTMTVRDFGAGIAAEHLPRLTERFYRVDATSSRTKGGTGLGLAIVKHIVARHRGALKITSTLGEGSQFRVTIPSP